MIVAYVTADYEALTSIFSDPDKFVAAAPFPFLLSALVVLAFGAGAFSLDALIKRFAGGGRSEQLSLSHVSPLRHPLAGIWVHCAARASPSTGSRGPRSFERARRTTGSSFSISGPCGAMVSRHGGRHVRDRVVNSFALDTLPFASTGCAAGSLESL
jgi:hypothetical protein